MNNYTSQATALLAIVAGILICFWGYKLLKLSLGLIGFVVGAYAGWQGGIAGFHLNEEAALVCAVVGGLIGAVLCIWLFFFGVFLIGATAGGAVAAGVYNGSGHQIPPLILFIIPLVFGILALIAQKFMIAISSAFSGAYLITAGLWSILTSTQDGSRIWLHPSERASDTTGYAALAIWLVLGFIGAGYQLGGGRKKVQVPQQEARAG